MPQADFYVLKGVRNPGRFTCSITNKAWSHGNRVFIIAKDQQQAVAIDDLLWTYHDISFLPHTTIDNVDTASPVTIGWDGSNTCDADVVINLTDTVPDCAADYGRVIEIITDDPDEKNKGRQRYKVYRDMGFDLINHNIDSFQDG
jgi:DNA polymerase-3 subunit chi